MRLLGIFGNSPIVISITFVTFAIILRYAYIYLIQPLIYSAVRFFYIGHQSEAVFLQITPPIYSQKTPLATGKLFSILREVMSQYEFISFEVASTRNEGIRFLIHLSRKDEPVVRRHIASYMPDVEFNVLEDFDRPEAKANGKFNWLYEVAQTRHYAYPLYKHEEYVQHDPVDYIIGSLTKLEAGEAIIMQIIVSPHESVRSKRLYNRLFVDGQANIDKRIMNFMLNKWWVWSIGIIFTYVTNYRAGVLLALVALGISFIFPKQLRVLTPAEQEIYDGALDKLSQPLFNSDIRLYISANSHARFKEFTNGISSSLTSLNVPRYQKLAIEVLYPSSISQKLGKYKFHHRLPSFFTINCNVMAANELGDLYHIPYEPYVVEDLSTSFSRKLPAPTSIKRRNDARGFDVVLGRNIHHNVATDIGLTADERQRHVYIIGGTGNGKTTLMKYAIVQDIRNGKGVAVVDPHGDLAQELLNYIPKERKKDLIYFNPSDITHPIGMNLLEQPDGLSEDEKLIERDFITESIVSIFRKTFSNDDSGGHRIEYVLRNAIHTAMTVEGATLFTVLKLLRNPKFRNDVTKKLDDEELKDFWKNEIGKAGEFQRVKMAAGITAKIDRYQRSESVKRIIGQAKSTIDFDEILDGKILICNLAKGLIGEDTSELMGTSILAKLQLAAFRRIRKSSHQRLPFFLYVDEFQNFATEQFLQMLSESRKYKLFLTMAEQSTAQQDKQRMVEVILNNVGTVICFRTGSNKDEELLLPRFKPFIEAGEISNLPAYSFYMRIQALEPLAPMSGETIVRTP